MSQFQPCWTHPVLPDGSLGAVRPVLMPPEFKPALEEFTLFPKLPLDLRVYIWRMAVNFERVVCVYEDIEEPDSDDEESDSDEDEDENHHAIVDPEEARHRGFYSYEGQSQLEDYGFTSSHPKPELPDDEEQTHNVKLNQEINRVGTFYSLCPMPVLLHVCRESRQLLQSYGYALAFNTRTNPARIWFNFTSDILHLYEASHPKDASPELDGGMWNIGQFSRQDLVRLRKLSLPLGCFAEGGYCYGGPVPVALHRAVQLCGNLEELLIVEMNTMNQDYEERESNGAYWDVGNDDADVVVVDLAIEEFWNHSLYWKPGTDPYQDWYRYRQQRSIKNFNWTKSSYEDIAKDIEEQLRCQRSFFPDRKEWSTPKVRFVMLAARHEITTFMRNRELYARNIDNMYWKKVAESRKSYRPPSPLNLVHDEEALHDQWMDEAIWDEPRPSFGFYKQAREAIHSVRGWHSPFTLEWIEASEARLDMDSWPWAEE